GHASTGKTSVVRALLDAQFPPASVAFVDCVHCYTPRLVFERALRAWNQGDAARCSRFSDFADQVRAIAGRSTGPQVLVASLAAPPACRAAAAPRPGAGAGPRGAAAGHGRIDL